MSDLSDPDRTPSADEQVYPKVTEILDKGTTELFNLAGKTGQGLESLSAYTVLDKANRSFTVQIGRDSRCNLENEEGHLTIPRETISRKHMELKFEMSENGGIINIFAIDQDSTNGIFALENGNLKNCPEKFTTFRPFNRGFSNSRIIFAGQESPLAVRIRSVREDGVSVKVEVFPIPQIVINKIKDNPSIDIEAGVDAALAIYQLGLMVEVRFKISEPIETLENLESRRKKMLGYILNFARLTP